jgi:hypothetical protein
MDRAGRLYDHGAEQFCHGNTDVHWVGDYPLALALGYISGKITVSRHKKKMINAVNL